MRETHPPASPAKPEHMTSLSGVETTDKADPRIELRGQLDSLFAEALLVRLEAPSPFEQELEGALALVRQMMTAEARGIPMETPAALEEQRRLSHHPELFGFGEHPVPCAAHGRFAALLNHLRTCTRECERCAARLSGPEGTPARPDLVHTLNRLSSWFYVMQLRAAAQQTGRQTGG